MKPHRIYAVLILGLVTLVLFLYGTGSGANVEPPVEDHQEALTIANQVTGFSGLSNFSELEISVKKVVVKSDDTVLLNWIEGRTFWKVSYAGIVVLKDGQRNPYINAFDVWVDVETGQVPKIASQWMAVTDMRYKIDEAEHVAYLREFFTRPTVDKTMARYSSPEDPPKISFLEALILFISQAGGGEYDELHDKRIVATYRWETGAGDANLPVWSLMAFGGKLFFSSVPVDGPRPERSDDIGVKKSMTIDATTGEILGWGGSS